VAGAERDVAHRVHDVLALRSDAPLLRVTTLGTERTGGGAWERPVLVLLLCGRDGLVTHFELFDPDREAEALARFDELTAERVPPRSPSSGSSPVASESRYSGRRRP
jgi:hypothetical protein